MAALGTAGVVVEGIPLPGAGQWLPWFEAVATAATGGAGQLAGDEVRRGVGLQLQVTELLTCRPRFSQGYHRRTTKKGDGLEEAFTWSAVEAALKGEGGTGYLRLYQRLQEGNGVGGRGAPVAWGEIEDRGHGGGGHGCGAIILKPVPNTPLPPMSSAPDLSRLTAIVTSAAQVVLMPRFGHVQERLKADGSAVSEADELIQQRIAQALASHWPDIPLLGEEMTADEQTALLAGQRFWCLDPLDGTSNFVAGIPLFSVSLALIEAGEVRLGIVYDPCRGECFAAERGVGAWLNGRPLDGRHAATELEQAIALVDFKRLAPALASRLALSPPCRSLRSLGSVALEWVWLAAGRGQLYLHGRQRLWDYAAGILIFQEAGGQATTMEGEPLFQLTLAGRSACAATGDLLGPWRAWIGNPSQEIP